MVGDPKETTDVEGRQFAVDAETVETDELNNGGVISDGDGIERQIWVIENGASDPAGAGPNDLIFEKEA